MRSPALRLLVLVWVAGCGEENPATDGSTVGMDADSPTERDGSAGDGSTSCSSSSCTGTCCDGACVDTTSNPEHCGACGNVCEANIRGTAERCIAGSCTACGRAGEPCCDVSRLRIECLDEWLRCGTAAVCEACGGADEPCWGAGVCRDGLGCDEGPWVCGCDPPTLERCGDACVDLETDVANCGECGNACAEGAECPDGECTCPTPATAICDGACVDTQTDASNCGECGVACGSTERCATGRCLPIEEAAPVRALDITTLFVAGDSSWSVVRNASTGRVSSSVGGSVTARYSPYWDEHEIARMAVRFFPPTLPPTAVIVGARLRIRPSYLEETRDLIGLHAVSFEPEDPTRASGPDYAIARWGTTSMGAVPVSSPAVDMFSETMLDESLEDAFAASGDWWIGIRVAPDLFDGTPAYGPRTFPGMTPVVVFDGHDDVELVVEYVVP